VTGGKVIFPPPLLSSLSSLLPATESNSFKLLWQVEIYFIRNGESNWNLGAIHAWIDGDEENKKLFDGYRDGGQIGEVSPSPSPQLISFIVPSFSGGKSDANTSFSPVSIFVFAVRDGRREPLAGEARPSRRALGRIEYASWGDGV